MNNSSKSTDGKTKGVTKAGDDKKNSTTKTTDDCGGGVKSKTSLFKSNDQSKSVLFKNNEQDFKNKSVLFKSNDQNKSVLFKNNNNKQTNRESVTSLSCLAASEEDDPPSECLGRTHSFGSAETSRSHSSSSDKGPWLVRPRTHRASTFSGILPSRRKFPRIDEWLY